MSPSSERAPAHMEVAARVRCLLERTLATELMASPVRCCKDTMTRAQVGNIMLGAEISAMPVVDDHGVVVGLVTKTDIIREDYGEARNQGAAGQIGKFMTPFVLKLHEDDNLNTAVNLMAKAGVHHVVITDAKGHARGILSSLDFMRWLAGLSQAAELEEEMSHVRGASRQGPVMK